MAYDTGHMSASYDSGQLFVYDNGSQVADFTLSGLTGTVGVENDGHGATEIYVVCFARGTRILTERGMIAVEDLRAGERAITFLGRSPVPKPIRWIGRRKMDAARHPAPELVWPVRIRKDAFGDNMPARDLLVSPQHAIFVDGILVPAITLTNDVHHRPGQERPHGRIFPCRAGCPRHPAGRGTDRRELSGLWQPPVLRQCRGADAAACRTRRGAGAGHRLVRPGDVHRPEVAAVKRRLIDRVKALGWRALAQPDLRIVANGREMAPSPYEQVRRVTLAAGLNEVRLISAAAQPIATDPFTSDDRRLGISIAGLSIVTPGATTPIDLDDADIFGPGWHEVEGPDGQVHRWTDGAATLSVTGPGVLEITIGNAWLRPSRLAAPCNPCHALSSARLAMPASAPAEASNPSPPSPAGSALSPGKRPHPPPRPPENFPPGNSPPPENSSRPRATLRDPPASFRVYSDLHWRLRSGISWNKDTFGPRLVYDDHGRALCVWSSLLVLAVRSTRNQHQHAFRGTSNLST